MLGDVTALADTVKLSVSGKIKLLNTEKGTTVLYWSPSVQNRTVQQRQSGKKVLSVLSVITSAPLSVLSVDVLVPPSGPGSLGYLPRY